MTPEQAFAEAIEQMPRRVARADMWTSRAVFWVAVRAGAGALGKPWADVRDRWAQLWAVACEEHLPPIPGAAHVGTPLDVAAAEQNLERMRAMVGARRR